MPKRFYEPLEVEFGGEIITIEPLRGLERIQKFEKATLKQVLVVSRTIEQSDAFPSFIYNWGQLIKLGCANITEAAIANSTSREQVGIMRELCEANNMGALTAFFDMFQSLPAQISSFMKEKMQSLLAGEEFSLPSSEPGSAGPTSSIS